MMKYRELEENSQNVSGESELEKQKQECPQSTDFTATFSTFFFFPAWTKANPARGPQKPYTEPQLL